MVFRITVIMPKRIQDSLQSKLYQLRAPLSKILIQRQQSKAIYKPTILRPLETLEVTQTNITSILMVKS